MVYKMEEQVLDLGMLINKTWARWLTDLGHAASPKQVGFDDCNSEEDAKGGPWASCVCPNSCKGLIA